MKKKIAIATLSLLPLSASNVFASGQDGIVTATSLNVRSGPSVKDSFLFSLKQNDRVNILEKQSGWYKIKASNGKTGWACSDYIKTCDNQVENLKNEKVVNVDNLNMRNGASTSYRIITKIKKGTKVELISENSGWSKIKYDGRIGHVASQYLSNNTIVQNPPKSQNVSSGKIKVVKATSLNVRSGPSTSNSVIGSVKQNEKVNVISERYGWAEINYSGKQGYLSSSYLGELNGDDNKVEIIKPQSPPQTQSKLKMVIATSLNVRSGPSTNTRIVTTLKQNAQVEVISEANGWSKVICNGKQGYVSNLYIKDLNNESDSTGQNQVVDSNTGASSSTVNGATVNNINLNYTLSQHINKQVGKRNGNMIASRGFTQASQSDIAYYINPGNFTGSQKGMLQFLRLDSFKEGITANELNGFLNSLRSGSNGTNVFYNQGQAFIDAARKYNIDVAYLVGHSMLETGYGRSTLAQGQTLTSYKGQALSQPVKVYNFFGIGAFDGTANLSGAEAAYKNGWTSVESTIEGSAKWISSNYIHSRYGQNTLYKMRWSYDYLNHQYATDVNWANAISSVMNKIINMYDTNSNLVYEVPVHKK